MKDGLASGGGSQGLTGQGSGKGPKDVDVEVVREGVEGGK